MKNKVVLGVAAFLAVAACGKKNPADDPAKSAPTAGGTPTAPTPAPTPSDVKTASGGDVGDLKQVNDCPKALAGSEKVARTIPKGCGPILVTSGWQLEGALTVEAGVTFKFQEGVDAQFGRAETTKVVIKGTPQEPVTMTSAGDAVAGFWSGVWFGDHTGRSRIENLVIEHGGDEKGILRLSSNDIVVKGLTVRDAKVVGLYIDDNVRLGELSGATFEKAGKIAVSLPTAAIAAVAPGNKFDAGAFVEVRGGALEDSAKWQNPGAPYVFRSGIDVHGKAGRATLEIAAGTELRFDQDLDFDVGYNGAAALVVAGTADKPVIFTGSDASVSWHGLWLYNGSDAKIDFASFSGGGSDANRGVLLVDSGATLTLTSSIFKGNKGGVTLTGEGKIKAFDKNQLDGGERPALSLPSNEVAGLGAGNTFAKEARIEIHGGKVKSAATWVPQTVPYSVLDELVVDEKGALTLQPGVDIVFAKDQQMSVGYNGEASLKAVGTAEKPIKLHGEHDDADAWKGLFFYDHARDSELGNVRLEGAGGDAGVIVKEGATVKISDLVCAKCTNAAVTSACKSKVDLKNVKAEGGTPKDVIKPEGCQ